MPVPAENPAARLYSLFSTYGKQRKMSIGQAWATTLRVTENELPFQLVGVFALLRDVRQQVEESEDPRSRPMLGHLEQLATCILPPDLPLNKPVEHRLPDLEAHNALGFFAMSRSADEWDALPGEEEQQRLIDNVQELIRAVMDATDLPSHIRHALLGRLHDVLRALTHLDVGGPDAVRRAAESLAVATALLPPDSPEEHRKVVGRVRRVADATWNAVTVVSVVTTLAINADKMVNLPILDPPAVQRQIPQTTSPAPLIEDHERPGTHDHEGDPEQ
jgi:hypothetical protein